MPPADLSPLNDREYRKLLLSLTLNAQRLDLQIAISDDRNLQDQLITAYEADLKSQGIATLRARLDPKRPSLRATLEELVTQTPALQAGEPAVVTVLNAGELLGVRLSDEKSEQEKFFFSLQWTREALRNFEFPIVLWLPDAVATRLAQQAPDFWSWRGGVFEFVAEARVPETGRELLPMPSREMSEEREKSPVAIADLQQQIAQLEATASESPLLITLYNNLGEAYEGQYQYQPALELYEKALTMAEAKSDPAGEARSLFNLGNALQECGRPFQAMDYYQQALDKYRELGNRSGEAATLRWTGSAYYSLGQYQQAIEHYQQSLAIALEIGDRRGEANSLGGLGNAYSLLGQYQRAIEYYRQQLAITREISDRRSEAYSFGCLGFVYDSLGQYQQAIEYYRQQLAITREIGDRFGEANSLGGLGNAYNLREQYQQAIDSYQQSLAIVREIGDRFGEASSLGGLGNAYNLRGQYQQAIDSYWQQLAIAREIGDRRGEANSFGGLGLAYKALGQYQQAIEYYQQWLAIAREIGDCKGEAAALFNLGYALARVDKKWEARQAYEAARTLYQEMGLAHKVEKCDQALYNLGQMVVMQPKQAPTIGEAPLQEPDWLVKSMLSAPRSTPSARPQKVPITLWFLLCLSIAALLWWFLR